MVCQLIPWERIVSLAHLEELSWEVQMLRFPGSGGWQNGVVQPQQGPANCIPRVSRGRLSALGFGYIPGAFNQRLIMADVCFCATVNCIFIRDVGEGGCSLVGKQNSKLISCDIYECGGVRP